MHKTKKTNSYITLHWDDVAQIKIAFLGSRKGSKNLNGLEVHNTNSND